jgi:hypothetical protein
MKFLANGVADHWPAIFGAKDQMDQVLGQGLCHGREESPALFQSTSVFVLYTQG